MNASTLVRTAIGVVTFAAAGQLVAGATGHAWAPWSAAHDPAPQGDHRPEPASSHTPPSQAREPECPPDGASEQSPAPDDGVGQVLTLVVPATSILETGRNARVVAATTNTGCPPRPSDDLWLRTSSGALEPAAPTALRGVKWFADPAVAGRYVRHPPHP